MMTDSNYLRGFDDGFDAAINELLFFIERYDDNDIEFKMTCTNISNDIKKYFLNEAGRYETKNVPESTPVVPPAEPVSEDVEDTDETIN